MPGIFNKMKAGRERMKVKEIQKEIDKIFKNFKESFEEELRNAGLSIDYIALVGSDAAKRMPGSIVARFVHKEGYPITLVQAQHIYELSGLYVPRYSPIVYPGPAFWGTIVQGSIPYTLIYKRVGKGFAKGKAKVFLPLTSLPFDEKKLLNDPRLQEPLLAALNADTKLVDAVDAIPLAFSFTPSYKRTMTISCPDIGGQCAIIPMESETAIFLRYYGSYGYVGKFETVLEILSDMRKHILAHPHAEKVSGKVPAAVFNTMYALCKMKPSEPPKEIVF